MTSDKAVENINSGLNAISAAAATSISTTQTRLSFYDAQEVHLQYSENKDKKKAGSENSNGNSTFTQRLQKRNKDKSW